VLARAGRRESRLASLCPSMPLSSSALQSDDLYCWGACASKHPQTGACGCCWFVLLSRVTRRKCSKCIHICIKKKNGDWWSFKNQGLFVFSALLCVTKSSWFSLHRAITEWHHKKITICLWCTRRLDKGMDHAGCSLKPLHLLLRSELFFGLLNLLKVNFVPELTD